MDGADRLASARAVLARAETAAGVRTRLRLVPDAGARPGRSGAGLEGAGSGEGTGVAAEGAGAGEGAGVAAEGAGALVLGLRSDGPRPTGVPAVRPGEGTGADASGPGPVGEDHLPVPAALAPLLPAGLPRGTVTRVTGSAALLLSLAGAACGEEGWAALTAMPDVGWQAAAAAGLPLDRVVVVPDPGPGAPAVLGALVDGVEVLLLGRCPAMAPRDRRALISRLRRRGSVLLTAHAWEGADTVLSVHGRTWRGLAPGRGMLAEQEVEVRLSGRRGAVASGHVGVRIGAHGVRPIEDAGRDAARDAARDTDRAVGSRAAERRGGLRAVGA